MNPNDWYLDFLLNHIYCHIFHQIIVEFYRKIKNFINNYKIIELRGFLVFAVFSSPHILFLFFCILIFFCILMLISSIKYLCPNFSVFTYGIFFCSLRVSIQKDALCWMALKTTRKKITLQWHALTCLLHICHTSNTGLMEMNSHSIYHWMQFLFGLAPWWHCHRGKDVSVIQFCFVFFKSSTLTYANTWIPFAYWVGAAEPASAS